MEIQILIDSVGKPCLLSAKNETNVSSKELKLPHSINNTSKWKAAIVNEKHTNTSVSVILVFENGTVTAKRRTFDFSNSSNMKAVGTPEVAGTERSKLSETWTVFTQDNSALPWDMSRAVVTDKNNLIWIGTDNGIAKVEKGKWEVFNNQNSNIKAVGRNKNQMPAIRDIAVDNNNNKWFIAGYDVYKYDNKSWTVYDSINSPINWARKIYVDKSNNIWFTSWEGVAKFNGSAWTVFNKKNSQLPSDKTLGVFMDSKNRVWIGTFEGNVMIENKRTIRFLDKNSPLSKAYISQMYEDKAGNLWFSLYNEKGSDAGIYISKTDGSWERIMGDKPNFFSKNSINYFLLDEDKDMLWITQNNVGIIKYDLKRKSYEIYTNENSNVPSVNVEQLTKDKDGAIWAATYAGVVKLNIL
ncbi:ligand-binding sensor domain-containing protein [Pedobacter jamesrossensis]